MTPLFINGRFLTQRVTGVQRFAIEICKQLVQLRPEVRILVPASGWDETPELKSFLKPVGKRTGTLWEQLDLSIFMRKQKGMLLNLCNTAPLNYNRNVVTIHDMGIFENSSWYDTKFATWYKYMTPRIARKALGIITVSEFSRKEIIQHLRVDEAKISVVYNGLSDSLKGGNDDQKEKLILHVGTFNDRKNVKFLVDCFLRSTPNEYKLVLCGGHDRNLIWQAIDSGSDRIRLIEGTDDTELSTIYSKASYVISASHYEGFGLPVLEGVAFGAIPVLSDIPVYHELFGNVGKFYNPNNEYELISIFNDLPEVPSKIEDCERQRLLEKFDFKRSAIKLQKLISEL